MGVYYLAHKPSALGRWTHRRESDKIPPLACAVMKWAGLCCMRGAHQAVQLYVCSALSPTQGGPLPAQTVKPPVSLPNLTSERTCRGTPDPRDESLAAHLMRVRDPDGRLLPHARQWSELSIFFYAGMETTAHTIAW